MISLFMALASFALSALADPPVFSQLPAPHPDDHVLAEFYGRTETHSIVARMIVGPDGKPQMVRIVDGEWDDQYIDVRFDQTPYGILYDPDHSQGEAFFLVWDSSDESLDGYFASQDWGGRSIKLNQIWITANPAHAKFFEGLYPPGTPPRKNHLFYDFDRHLPVPPGMEVFFEAYDTPLERPVDPSHGYLAVRIFKQWDASTGGARYFFQKDHSGKRSVLAEATATRTSHDGKGRIEFVAQISDNPDEDETFLLEFKNGKPVWANSLRDGSQFRFVASRERGIFRWGLNFDYCVEELRGK